jgi:hypothetical protein
MQQLRVFSSVAYQLARFPLPLRQLRGLLESPSQTHDEVYQSPVRAFSLELEKGGSTLQVWDGNQETLFDMLRILNDSQVLL